VAAVLSRDGGLDAGFLRAERDAAARAAVFRRAAFFAAGRFFALTRFLTPDAFRGEVFAFRAAPLPAVFRPVVFFFVCFVFATLPPDAIAVGRSLRVAPDGAPRMARRPHP
jgi:hypothetical protein